MYIVDYLFIIYCYTLKYINKIPCILYRYLRHEQERCSANIVSGRL